MGYGRENTIPIAHIGGANAVCTITSAAPPPNNRLRLRYVFASYSAAPTGGVLTITDGVNVAFAIDLPTAAPLILPNLDVQCAAGAAITLALAAGGGGIIGKINAYATFE